MNKIVKYIIFALVLLISMPLKIYAGRGCCSWHGGVAGCTSRGRTICADGTLSPSCTCTPPTIYGCTDMNAKNYNSNANTNDGSCMYYTYGCTNPNAKNYNPNADKSDYSCIYYKMGCTDSSAKNYDSDAEKDDGSCEYYIMGCTDKKALNYNQAAEKDDNSCEYEYKKGYSAAVSNNNINKEEIMNKYADNKSNDNDDMGTGVPLLILAGIGAGVYYKNAKKKKEETKNISSLFKREKKKNFMNNNFK